MNRPSAVTVPPLALQWTLVLLLPDTVAVNCTVWPASMLAVAGETVTTTSGALLPPHATSAVSRGTRTHSGARWVVVSRDWCRRGILDLQVLVAMTWRQVMEESGHVAIA